MILDPPGPLRCPAPVERITGVWRFTRTPGARDECAAPGGHLLHLLVTGSATITCDGRRHTVQADDLVAYYGRTPVRFRAGDGPVEFWSVGFTAPGLTPPLPDHRVRRASASQRRAFAGLIAAAAQPASPRRTLAMHARLLALIAPLCDAPAAVAPWPRAELWLRDRHRFRPGIEELAAAAGCSMAALRQSCRDCTGGSIRAALAHLRLTEAQALLAGGDLTVGAVARRLGYRRTQELSRAYARRFGVPPGADRGESSAPS
jgi:AraC-like DNA-binding protein